MAGALSRIYASRRRSKQESPQGKNRPGEKRTILTCFLKKKTDRSKNDRALEDLFAPTPQKALFPFDKPIGPAKRCTVRMD
jgi:hypothetical protein